MASTSRLLALLSLLQARRDWPGALLAERLEVSERTVRRDVDRLRELGYDVQAAKGPDGGYRLGAGLELPPLLLDDEQAVAIAIALRGAAGLGTAEEGADRALATLRQVLPERLRHRVDAIDVAMAVREGPTTDPRVLEAVSTAARARTVLRFDYGSVDPARPPRRVEPHAVVGRNGRWYLVAWDLGREDWRVFRIDRILPSSHGGGRFTPRALPGGDPVAFVEGRFRGNAGPGGWPCSGEAVVALPPEELAPYLADGSLVDLGDGRSRVVLGAWSWEALAARLLGFGAALDEVRPSSLRSAFTTLSTRASAAGA